MAVRAARRWFHLPYFDASMSCAADGDDVVYRSRRTHAGAPPAEFAARYGPTGPESRATRGSLDHWLTERYCLYAAEPGGALLRGEIHHAPWPLQAAHAEIDVNSMADAAGVPLPPSPRVCSSPAGSTSSDGRPSERAADSDDAPGTVGSSEGRTVEFPPTRPVPVGAVSKEHP